MKDMAQWPSEVGSGAALRQLVATRLCATQRVGTRTPASPVLLILPATGSCESECARAEADQLVRAKCSAGCSPRSTAPRTRQFSTRFSGTIGSYGDAHASLAFMVGR